MAVKGLTFSSKKDAKEYADQVYQQGFRQVMVVRVGPAKYVVVKEPSKQMMKAAPEDLPGIAKKQLPEQTLIDRSFPRPGEDEPTLGERLQDLRAETEVPEEAFQIAGAGRKATGTLGRSIRARHTKRDAEPGVGRSIKAVPDPSRLKWSPTMPRRKE